MYLKLTLAFLLGSVRILTAQNTEDRANIISQTNVEKLQALAKKYEAQNEAARLEIKNRDVSTQKLLSHNRIGYLSGFDKNGDAVYDTEDNLNAARTSRIHKIWTGGTSGLDLDGSGIRIGHWEASGLALFAHQEFGGRVSHAETASISSHATHTAGTMIGSGVLGAAKGMAGNARIMSRRSNGDEGELAIFGALGGILSNHSYSSGNPDGVTSEYGVYTENTGEWDEIAYNAPFLLMCKSAGNNRNDGDANILDGGYDIIYTIAAAKNIITVGATNDVLNYSGPLSVKQSEFSNWGPTDDWRIKPDITTNGVSVYSADNFNTSDYGTKSGTSMSTPTVTGSIALLQQHYHNLTGDYMRSATAKALILGTADEVGANDGPDFQSGWGLLNAERAAKVITGMGITSEIMEETLSNFQTFTTDIEVDGTEPLAITVVWTDPKGTPVSGGTDNPKPMLVNDLDIRLANSLGEYKPWVMIPNENHNNFTSPAVKGDNTRDNIERIDVANIPAGKYKLNISHKGNLMGGMQAFSIVAHGLVTGPTSTNNTTLQNSLMSVFPNPSSGHVSLKFDESIQGAIDISVYDIQGKLIFQLTETRMKDDTRLDITSLEKGTYLIVAKSNEAHMTQKLFVN